MVSLGEALAKRDMMTPIRLHTDIQIHNGCMWRGQQSQTYLAYGEAGNLSSCRTVPEVPQCHAN